MLLFPSSPDSSSSQMRRRRQTDDLHKPPDDYDLAELMEEMKIMEVEYRQFKQDMLLRIRDFEQRFVDYEYLLTKIVVHKNVK